MPHDTAFLSVTELAAGYRSGRFTPVDVCMAAQARLERMEPSLNAFITPMKAEVLQQAQEATAALASGRDLGPLHGIPVAIKDIIDVAGVETGYGTRAVAPRLAERDADCVRRLRQAGAIIFGKTNLLEFAAGIAHPDFGQTNNPHDPHVTAGGSSGGSAAAVAAGIVPLSIGTDSGGSVRAPAAYCGIAGFKPSFGLLSLEGVFPLSPSLDHLGLFARSCANLSALFDVLDPPGEQQATVAAPPGLRLGIVTSQWDHPAVQPGVRALIDRARQRLEDAGMSFVPVTLPAPEDMARDLLNILMPEAAVVHRETLGANADGYASGTRALLAAGGDVPATSYIEALRQQATLRQHMAGLMADVDALLAPTVPFVAPANDPALSLEGDDEIIALSHANLTGAPSISIPCGRDGALPVGLQLTGAIGGDRALLRVAAAVEALLD